MIAFEGLRQLGQPVLGTRNQTVPDLDDRIATTMVAAMVAATDAENEEEGEDDDDDVSAEWIVMPMVFGAVVAMKVVVGLLA